MNVKMPNGQIVNNVPEGTTKQQLADKWSSFTGEKIDVALFVNPDKTTDKTLPIVHRVSPTNRLVPGGTLQEIDDSQAKLKDFTVFSNTLNPIDENKNKDKFKDFQKAIDTDFSESYKVNLDSFNKITRDPFDADFETPLFKDVKLTVGDVLDYPELYKTSPYVKDMVLNIVNNKHENYTGLYDPTKNEITLNTNLIHMGFIKDERAMFRTLIHEIQHAIEEKEYLKHKQKGLLTIRDVLYANEDYVSNEVFSFKAEQRSKLSAEYRRIEQNHPMDGGFQYQRDERLKHDLVGRGYHQRTARDAMSLFQEDILHRRVLLEDLNVDNKKLTNYIKTRGQRFIVKDSKNFIELNGIKLDRKELKEYYGEDHSIEEINNSIAKTYLEDEYAKENSTNNNFQEQDFTRKLNHIKDKYIKKDSKIGSDLNIDLVGNIYNTTKDPNNNKWLDLAKTRKPKTAKQVKNLEDLLYRSFDAAQSIYKVELETLKNRGYSDIRIQTMLRPIIAAESNFGVDTNNTVSSDVAGQMQVKYSTFQDLFNKKYLGKEFSKETGITQKDLKNMPQLEFKKLMNEDQKFDHLVGIGALLQKLKNHSDGK